MNRKNTIDASDKLSMLYNKVSFISRVVMYMKNDSYTFNSSDISGFSVVLDELQDEIKEIKELID